MKQAVVHHYACTWNRHRMAGETAPGQTFWGQLNYIWCHGTCARMLRDTDYMAVYHAARGESETVDLKKYRRLWRWAIFLEFWGFHKAARSVIGTARAMIKPR